MPNLRERRRVKGPLDERAQESVLRVWNENDPRSLIRIVPESMRAAILAIPEELRDLDEQALIKLFHPTPTMCQIRLLFWLEYDRAQERFMNMKLANVVSGVCSEEMFYNKLLKNAQFVAFLVTPPATYMVALEEAVMKGIQRQREVLDVDPMIPDPANPGKFKLDVKLATLQMKITAYLDMRKNGGITQKIETNNQSTTISVAADAAELLEYKEGKNMEQLQKRLDFLEKREQMLEKGVHPGKPSPMDIEVEAEVVKEPNGS